MNIIINLNKPKGISSQQAVTRVKNILKIKKAGHAGTLDPLATGVLLVCINEATKITRFLSDMDKEYRAVMKLGERTDTLDAEGTIIEKTEGFDFKGNEIENVLKKFTGTIAQTPPMYSAVKIDGKPLYKLARRGIEIERPERSVAIHRISVNSFVLPFLDITVSCSKGTYIRTLCSDIGETLGAGAYVVELERTAIGEFRIEDSVTIDGLEDAAAAGHEAINNLPAVITIDAALTHLIEVTVNADEQKKLSKGATVRRPEISDLPAGFVRLKDPSESLFAVGILKGGVLKIERALHVTK